MSKKSISLAKSGAAGLANSTRHRKIQFKSKAEVIQRIRRKEHMRQINEEI